MAILECKKMMCVVAHPDDESFLFGGALGLAAARGNKTFVICLTDGRAATHRGDSTSGASLGKIRREEFRAACDVLGVAQYELMDFDDGGLEFVNFSIATRKLVERIRQFKPDIVITFGSDGSVNTHPDHTMVSLFTTAAFHWAGYPERYPELGQAHKAHRLYHLTTSFFVPGRVQPAPTPWTVMLNIRSVLDCKVAAALKHLSQAPLIEQAKPLFEKYGGEEFYALVATTEPQAVRATTDLFEDLG